MSDFDPTRLTPPFITYIKDNRKAIGPDRADALASTIGHPEAASERALLGAMAFLQEGEASDHFTLQDPVSYHLLVGTLNGTLALQRRAQRFATSAAAERRVMDTLMSIMRRHLDQYPQISYPEHEAAYFLDHFRRFLRNLGQAANTIDLNDPQIGYLTQMSPDLYAKHVLDIGQLRQDAELIEQAKDLSVAMLELNGGLGSSMGLDPTQHHSKATGILIPVTVSTERGEIKASMSIMEAKMRTLAALGQKFKSVRVFPLNSTITRDGFQAFLDAPTVEQRALSRTGLTNRANLESRGLIIDDEIIQHGFPKIDTRTLLPVKTGNMDTELGPGGHGQILYELFSSGRLEELAKAGTDILVIGNGDGKQAKPDPAIAAKIARDGIPAAMISTDRTALDAKGGIFVIIDGKIQIIERNQAKDTDAFEAIGLKPDEGSQPFNTNTVYLNIPKIIELLTAYKEEQGEEALRELLLPTTIANHKVVTVHGQAIPVRHLEGAIGSVILKLPGVKIFNASADDRWTEFTAAKTPGDVVYLFDSDVFRIDAETGEMIPLIDNPIPPKIKLTGWSGWTMLPKTREAFGRPSMKDLRSLSISGKVHLRNAILRGHVEIINEYGHGVRLNEGPYCSNLSYDEQSNGKKRLLLENVRLYIDADGILTVTPLEDPTGGSTPPVANGTGGEGEKAPGNTTGQGAASAMGAPLVVEAAHDVEAEFVDDTGMPDNLFPQMDTGVPLGQSFDTSWENSAGLYGAGAATVLPTAGMYI